MNLQAYRRHLTSCAHREKGQNFTLCECPIWAYGRVNGAPFRRSLGTNNWERAMRRIQILDQGGDLAPLLPDSPSLTVGGDLFLQTCRDRNLEASTIDSYENTLRHLTNALGETIIARVDVPLLDRYRAGRKIAATTWRKELETLRAFFAWCVERKWSAENPAKKLRMPQTESLTTLPFTETEIQKLLAAADRLFSDNPELTVYVRKRAKALVLVLLYSGLRISDVTRLHRAALSQTGHLILKTLKTGVHLKVLLHRDAVDALERLPAVSLEYFFWTGNGDPMTCTKNLRRTIQRVGKLAGIHAHPHRFRDTFAVELLTQGADIRTVQKLLGHDSVRTTEKHYAHFVAAHQALLDAAAATLDFGPKAQRPLLVKPLKNRRRNA